MSWRSFVSVGPGLDTIPATLAEHRAFAAIPSPWYTLLTGEYGNIYRLQGFNGGIQQRLAQFAKTRRYFGRACRAHNAAIASTDVALVRVGAR